MKKTAFTVLLLISFLFIPSVLAQEVQVLGGEDGFSPGSEVELIQICANCTFVNLTKIFIYENQNLETISETLTINSPMTKDGTVYNYTLNGSNTDIIGSYVVNWVADPDGVLVVGSYLFYVRNNATLLTTAEAILYVILLLLSLALFVFFLYFGIVMPYSDQKEKNGTVRRWIPSKYFKVISLWIGYGFLLWFLNLLTGIANNFISLSLATNIIRNLYVFVLILSYPITIAVLGVLTLQFYWDFFVPLFKMLLGKNANRKK